MKGNSCCKNYKRNSKDNTMPLLSWALLITAAMLLLILPIGQRAQDKDLFFSFNLWTYSFHSCFRISIVN